MSVESPLEASSPPAVIQAWPVAPASSSDPLAANEAARRDAALFRLSGRARLVLTGKDRAKFLHGFCTNNITALKPGEGCEAFLTNIKGRILDHLFVAAREDSIVVDATAGSEDRIADHLDRYLITEDVQIAKTGAESKELLISGPNTVERMAASIPRLRDLPQYGHVSLDDRGTFAWRVDLLGAPGVRVLFSDAARGAAGEEIETIFPWASDLTPAGPDVFEPLRIEAGLPTYGVDLTDDNLAQEAMRTNRAISFKKGCYLGQEPIARIDALGHINRQLAGLRLESPRPPERGTKLLDAAGQEIGSVTTAAAAPGASQAVALAMLKSAHAKNGARVRVQTTDGEIPATVFGWT